MYPPGQSPCGPETPGLPETPFSLPRGQYAQSLPSLTPGIPDTLFQKLIGISVPLQGAGNPEAIDIEVSFRFDGHPGILPGNILNETLAPFLAPVKHKPLRKPLLQPLLFHNTLLIGHGAADVLPINVFVCNAQVVHIHPPTAGAPFCIFVPNHRFHPADLIMRRLSG